MTSPNENLYLGLTAADMAKEVSSVNDVTYWAKVGTAGEEGITSNHETTEQKHKINTVTLTGGDKGVQYKCTAKFDISVTGLESGKEQLQDGDGLLKLYTEGSSGVKVGIANSNEGTTDTDTTSHTLKSLANPDGEGNSFWLIYEFTATESSDTADLKASFSITNRKDNEPNDGNQNYLAGKEIKVTIKASDKEGEKLDCQIVQPA